MNEVLQQANEIMLRSAALRERAEALLRELQQMRDFFPDKPKKDGRTILHIRRFQVVRRGSN